MDVQSFNGSGQARRGIRRAVPSVMIHVGAWWENGSLVAPGRRQTVPGAGMGATTEGYGTWHIVYGGAPRTARRWEALRQAVAHVKPAALTAARVRREP